MKLGRKIPSKKGAYFFVLDAFIAGIIIVSTLAILFGVTATPEDPRQNYLLAEDFMSLLETTTLISYPTPVRFELQADGNITDLSKSILETIVELYATFEDDDKFSEDGVVTNDHPAYKLLEELSARKPENSGMAFYIQRQEKGLVKLYESEDVDVETSQVKLVTQRIVLDSALEPYFVEVRMWR